MSKYLDKVIEEMGSYSDMGMPDGEGAMGMGSVATMGMRGGHQGKAIKAYKLNDVLRHRNQAEEEEGMDDMDDYESDDMGDNTEELKQFFMDNTEPSDEEIAQYAEEKGMDLQEMRKAVFALIQSLLPDDEEGMDDNEMDSMDDEDSMDFSVSGDTGERPAFNELGSASRS